MEQIKNIVIVIVFFFCANPINAQLFITEYIKVKDFNSGLSHQAVEDAIYSKGVKDVKWDEETQLFTVCYEWRKTTMSEIREKIENLMSNMGRVEVRPESFDKIQDRKPRATKVETASK
jgi:hypothetical protein